MSCTAALQRRVRLLESSRLPFQRHLVRMHIVDCAPAERPARVAEIEASEPGVVHIVRVIVDTGERRPVADTGKQANHIGPEKHRIGR